MTRPTKEERIKFNVDYASDTDFSAYARLLQSKWRDKKKLPFVSYGNFLPADLARKEKSNFLTDRIKTLVQYELYRKGIFGKLIKEDRMWENLLSSQPLRYYKPIWNTKIDGFGNHDPGSGRYNQAKSEWDIIHPGRPWADKCLGTSSTIDRIEEKAAEYFILKKKKDAE